MQRQSLGSPLSKLNTHGGVARDDDQARCKVPAKLHRLSSSSISTSTSPVMWIHVVPLLTVFCFLVLYLCSHVPSQTDLVQFDGFNLKGADFNESIQAIDEIGQLSDLRNSHVLPVPSLQSKCCKLSRKLGDFP